MGLEKQLVGALGPISKGEVAMWEPEAGGEGRECVIGGYFSAATALEQVVSTWGGVEEVPRNRWP